MSKSTKLDNSLEMDLFQLIMCYKCWCGWALSVHTSVSFWLTECLSLSLSLFHTWISLHTCIYAQTLDPPCWSIPISEWMMPINTCMMSLSLMGLSVSQIKLSQTLLTDYSLSLWILFDPVEEIFFAQAGIVYVYLCVCVSEQMPCVYSCACVLIIEASADRDLLTS